MGGSKLLVHIKPLLAVICLLCCISNVDGVLAATGQRKLKQQERLNTNSQSPLVPSSLKDEGVPYAFEDLIASKKTCSKLDYDFMLLIDRSGSVTHDAWRDTVKPMVNNIIDSLEVAPNKVNVGIITFQISTKIQVALGSATSKSAADIKATFSKVRSGSGGTDVLYGIEQAGLHLMQNARRNATPRLLIITDALWYDTQDQSRHAASQLYKDIPKLETYIMHIKISPSASKIDKNSFWPLVKCDTKQPTCDKIVESSWDDAVRKMQKLIEDVCEDDEDVVPPQPSSSSTPPPKSTRFEAPSTTTPNHNTEEKSNETPIPVIVGIAGGVGAAVLAAAAFGVSQFIKKRKTTTSFDVEEYDEEDLAAEEEEEDRELAVEAEEEMYF